MEKVNYFVYGLEPSILEYNLEKLLGMPLNMRFIHTDPKGTASTKGRSQRASMKQAQPRQSINTKNSIK